MTASGPISTRKNCTFFSCLLRTRDGPDADGLMPRRGRKAREELEQAETEKAEASQRELEEWFDSLEAEDSQAIEDALKRRLDPIRAPGKNLRVAMRLAVIQEFRERAVA